MVRRVAFLSAAMARLVGEGHGQLHGIDIMGQRVADDFGLLVNLFRHEVAIAALVDQAGRGGGDLHFAIGRTAFAVIDRDVGALHHHHIAIVEIGDAVGEGRQRESIRAQIAFGVAIADGQRRALARADQQSLMLGEQHGQRKRPRQPARGGQCRILGRQPGIEIFADEMGADFAVRFGCEVVALGLQARR